MPLNRQPSICYVPTQCPASTEDNHNLTDLTPSAWWHIFPCKKNIIPTARQSCSYGQITLIKVLWRWQQSILLSCEPLRSDRNICHTSLSSIFCLSLLESWHYSPCLWLSSNYSISVEIQTWPILSRGPNSMLLLFIKLLFWCSDAQIGFMSAQIDVAGPGSWNGQIIAAGAQ